MKASTKAKSGERSRSSGVAPAAGPARLRTLRATSSALSLRRIELPADFDILCWEPPSTVSTPGRVGVLETIASGIGKTGP